MLLRNERLSKLLREKLSELIVREINTEGALATITEVVLDKKLEHARVKVSVIPVESKEAVLREFVLHKEELRRQCMKQVPMKYYPKISFEYDPGFEEAARVEKLLIEDHNKEK